MSDSKKTDLERTVELYTFLQGEVPEDCVIKRKDMPRLTADQAHTVIWWLGNQYWTVTDHVERCDVCGEWHDTHSEGACLDFGKAPYQFCGSCVSSDEFHNKSMSRLNPNRKDYIKEMRV